MSKTLEERLQTLLDAHQTAKENAARAEGALQAAKKRLLDEFQLKDIKQAEKRLAEITKEGDDLNTELETGIKKLELSLSGNDDES